jgi:hypothetical protein
VNERGQPVEVEIMESRVNPSRGCLCRQPFAPTGLGKSEAEVDPAVFPQLEQPRIPNHTTQATIQDDPFAEAVCSLVFLIAS